MIEQCLCVSACGMGGPLLSSPPPPHPSLLQECPEAIIKHRESLSVYRACRQWESCHILACVTDHPSLSVFQTQRSVTNVWYSINGHRHN